MISVDTNILIYAHRRDSEWHQRAAPHLRSLAEGRSLWAIRWPCIHEFLAVATHPKIYDPPTPLDKAILQVEAWLESPSLVLLGEADGHWAGLRGLLESGRIAGPKVHDARIAALCLTHGVQVLWTVDRDFSRFPELATENPLINDGSTQSSIRPSSDKNADSCQPASSAAEVEARRVGRLHRMPNRP